MQYVITVKKEFVRDSQIFCGNEKDCEDMDIYEDENRWTDFFPTHFVGVFEGENEKEAIKKASKHSQIASFMLECVELYSEGFKNK